MTAMPGPIVAPRCLCLTGLSEDECVCSLPERMLRQIAYGPFPAPILTPEQRRWCIAELERVGLTDDETAPDQDLARRVLTAWRDRARDTGAIR